MKRETITNLLLLIIALLMAVYLYFMLHDRGRLDIKVNSAVSKAVSSIRVPTRPKDGYTPVKNIDYFDGKDGANATDSQVQQAVNTYIANHPVKSGKDDRTPVKGKDYRDGLDGDPGLTPQIRCNPTRNWWEVRYSTDDNWQLLNGEKVACMEKSNE